MSDVKLILAVALGVAIAVVYPTLYRYVRRQFPAEAGIFPSWLTAALKKYGALFLFSGVAAVILVATYRSANPDAQLGFWAAVVLGFGFEASIEKIIFPNSGTGGRSAPQAATPSDPPTRSVTPR